MDNMNTATKESRKKYLAPVVVLLLCVVSLTGAAYAYSSTVNVVNNTVTADEFVLQVYESDKTSVIDAPIALDKVTFYTATDVTSTDDTVTVQVDTTSLNDYKGKLVIKATGVTGSKAVTATISASKDTGTVTVTGATSTLEYDIDAGLYTDAACTSEFVSGTTQITFNGGVAELYYKVSVSVTGNVVFTDATPVPVDDNAAVKTAFVEQTAFNLSFSATGPIAA